MQPVRIERITVTAATAPASPPEGSPMVAPMTPRLTWTRTKKLFSDLTIWEAEGQNLIYAIHCRPGRVRLGVLKRSKSRDVIMKPVDRRSVAEAKGYAQALEDGAYAARNRQIRKAVS